MKKLLVAAVVALAFAGGTTAAHSSTYPPPVPKATTIYLDSFTLSPQVQYATNNFWCEYYGYASYFPSYTGQCPYQDFVATIHWKKVQHVTEYDICWSVKPVFSAALVVGWSCWTRDPTESGSPEVLSMTFDSATLSLNASQGTDQLWMVKTCNLDPVTHAGGCAESNVVSAEIPWTG